MKNKIINDKSFNAEKYIDKLTGFLTVDGVVARTGIQEYYGFELSDDLEAMKKYKVLRHPDDVLSKESLESYINATVTDTHPQLPVTIENINALNKGSVSNIETFEDDGIFFIKARVTIKDMDLIKKISDGVIELSAGYTNDLKKESGEYSGKQYDYRQTNIRINHVAVVEKGRCGGSCKLSIDNRVTISQSNQTAEDKMKKITVDGKAFDVPEIVADAFDAAMEEQNSLVEQKAELEKQLAEVNKKLEASNKDNEEEMKKISETVDALHAQIDTLKKSELSADAINALVAERADVIAFATSFLGDVDATMDTCSIKKAVVAKYIGDEFKDNSSKEYINASFDIIKTSKKSVNDSLQFNKDSKDTTVTRDSVVSAYHKSILGEK